MTDSERLEILIKWSGLTPNAFSKEIGYQKGMSIYPILNNGRPISKKVARNISNRYPTISESWLLTGEGEMIKPDNNIKSIIDETISEAAHKHISGQKNKYIIPLVPVTAMAGYGAGDSTVMDYEILEEYVVPEFLDKGVKFLIRASGPSMQPKYSNGDILACRPITDLTFFQWGKVYVLDTDQGPIVKRLFQCTTDNDAVECHSDNKDNYPPFKINKSSIRNVSIVIGVIRLE